MKKIGKIHYITNGQTEGEILQEVQEALDAGVDWIQLRIKNTELPFLEIAKKVKQLCGNATFIINDKVDVAKMLDADGVHLGKDDMPVDKARELLGDDKIIGGTANDLADCLNHELKGANYIGLGPFRYTTTKKKLSPVLGLEGYQRIAPKEESYGWQLHSLSLPILAIGGIALDDIDELKKNTVVHGVAISGLIRNAENKTKVVTEIKKRLEKIETAANA